MIPKRPEGTSWRLTGRGMLFGAEIRGLETDPHRRPAAMSENVRPGAPARYRVDIETEAPNIYLRAATVEDLR